MEGGASHTRGQRMREAERGRGFRESWQGSPARGPEAGRWEADLPEHRMGQARSRRMGDTHVPRPGRGSARWEHWGPAQEMPEQKRA